MWVVVWNEVGLQANWMKCWGWHRRSADRLRPIGLGLVFATIVVQGAAIAQGFDCAGLRAEIEASSSGASRASEFADAMRRQQYELQRTQAYADSIGCNGGFLFGGDSAQCEGLSARIGRMQDNIGQLQQQAQSEAGDGGERRRALVEQYNSYCSGTTGGMGQPGQEQNQQTLPLGPDGTPSIEAPGDTAAPPPTESKVLCVRHCDGGFFPIAYRATPDKLDGLAQLCKAQCPNAEVSIYTTSTDGGIGTAVTPEGTAYTALPAAFKYQKSYDSTCSCKAPHETWVQALAEAEKLVQSDKGDVTVTQKMSDAMSRPLQPAAQPPISSPAKPSKKTKAARKPRPSPPNNAVPLADQGAGLPPPVTGGADITRQFRRAAPTL